MDEPLGVDPAQRMLANAELAGIIGYDDGIGEKPWWRIAPHIAPSVAILTGFEDRALRRSAQQPARGTERATGLQANQSVVASRRW
ncbi:hypothetical protein [Mesorhizobium japonicum]|uniref:Msl9003 protein n=1 Tax=Mesorhizobium japonicum (strain LMG 29417 / CECT 9101 / MAFF 303099) TaxID=266835 RepID=Q982M1_RHILO|nr:hypothetical protein [Mesorhizobium japonicum]BAB54435.1 msl9003 [Mesorhizobium japonicum MAFF 303099]